MENVTYIDRITGETKEELIYGRSALNFLYGDSLLSSLLGRRLEFFLGRFSFFSRLYGMFQNTSFSSSKILPFVEKYRIDVSEFLDPVSDFRSFNDFFSRKLKPESRPVVPGKDVAVIPSDGKFLFYPEIARADGFVVKGKKFCLKTLLSSRSLFDRYESGSMLIARLCPTDYHRYHFPCDGLPGETKTINGFLRSVNPIAIKRNLSIFTQNKRVVCEIDTENFGKIAYLEIGATNVGSICQTYRPKTFQKKGSEKGFFSFGGSSLILLFEPKSILFDEDLLVLSEGHREVRCLFGQSMGRANR